MNSLKFKNILIPLLWLAIFISPGVAQAEIYKCKGKNGEISFRATPCGQKQAGIKRPETKIELNEDGTKKTKKQIIAERLQKEKEFLEANKRQRDEEQQRKQKLQQHQAKIKRNCEQAKKDLQLYERSGTLVHKGQQGKQRIVSDAERDKAILNAKRRISFWCRK